MMLRFFDVQKLTSIAKMLMKVWSKNSLSLGRVGLQARRGDWWQNANSGFLTLPGLEGRPSRKREGDVTEIRKIKTRASGLC